MSCESECRGHKHCRTHTVHIHTHPYLPTTPSSRFEACHVILVLFPQMEKVINIHVKIADGPEELQLAH